MSTPATTSRVSFGSNGNGLAGRYTAVFGVDSGIARPGSDRSQRAALSAELYMIELVAITARRPPNVERLLEILAYERAIEEKPVIHQAHKRRTGRAA